MSITINGQSRVPPGFRFHPTEEELLNYYLRKKVASEKIDLDVIRDVDLNKLEPWDIQEKCRIGSPPPRNDWYFFSHKDKKYPTGTRTNRATVAGFWKATGRDKVIYTTSKRIGMRKTLVFYKGRAPHGQKSDWIMHEYRLDEQYSADSNSLSNDHPCSSDASALEDGWVVCRVFKKKNFHKATMDHSPNSCDGKTQQLLRNPSSSDGALDQILAYMGRSCKQEAEALVKTNNQQHHLRPIQTVSGACSFSGRITKLPAQPESQTHELPSLTDVDFPMISGISYFDKPSYDQPDGIHAVVNASRAYQPAAEPNLNDWATLDRLVASHLNGDQSDAASKYQLACLDVDVHDFMLPDSHGGGGSGEGDLWSLASSASDHIGSI